MTTADQAVPCPICGASFGTTEIEVHVDKCLSSSGFTAICGICKKETVLSLVHPLSSCPHAFCRGCLIDLAREKVSAKQCSKLACPAKGCGKLIGARDLQELLGTEDFAKYESASVDEAMSGTGSLVRCPGCSAGIELVPTTPSKAEVEAAMKEAEGVTREAADCKCRLRLRCKCSAEFCAGCGSAPYHTGFTCDQFAAYQKAEHCRWCAKQLPAGRRGKACCDDAECAGKSTAVCKKVLPCGHPCCGIAGEKRCLPCLDEDCPKKADGEKPQQSGDDFCNICWISDLRSAPSIQLKCGHIFHFACTLKKIESRWPGSRITFGFLECPLCKKQIEHPALVAALDPVLRLMNAVQAKALQRLKQLGLDKAEEITKKESRWFHDPVGYSLHRFSYFLCWKCKDCYYGGERVCEGDDGSKAFDPKDLVCTKCCVFSAKADCDKHGTEYVEWKCRFCCSTAMWFCWGTTHFCDQCHKKAGEMVAKKPSQLPKCTCSTNHPPNGTEFLLGCSLCRYEKSCFR